MGYPTANKILPNVPKAWSDEPPNVKMYCYHGSQVNTPDVLTYADGYFPDYDPSIDYGDGDGTVNMRSLEACLLWRDKQKQPITYRKFSKGEHNGVLGDARLIRELMNSLS